jgi:hypothetical protein
MYCRSSKTRLKVQFLAFMALGHSLAHLNENNNLEIPRWGVTRYVRGGLYVSVRAGLIMAGGVQPEKEEKKVVNYMRKMWAEHWISQADKNVCHAEGCTRPWQNGGDRGGTEVTGGLRNILFAVAQLHSEGEGVDLKLLFDSCLGVGTGNITQFLCTEQPTRRAGRQET